MKQDDWVKVEDYLPSAGTRVVIKTIYDEYLVGSLKQITGVKYFHAGTEVYEIAQVLYWMELVYPKE